MMTLGMLHDQSMRFLPMPHVYFVRACGECSLEQCAKLLIAPVEFDQCQARE